MLRLAILQCKHPHILKSSPWKLNVKDFQCKYKGRYTPNVNIFSRLYTKLFFLRRLVLSENGHDHPCPLNWHYLETIRVFHYRHSTVYIQYSIFFFTLLCHFPSIDTQRSFALKLTTLIYYKWYNAWTVQGCLLGSLHFFCSRLV